jgi:hypothetical protein
MHVEELAGCGCFWPLSTFSQYLAIRVSAYLLSPANTVHRTGQSQISGDASMSPAATRLTPRASLLGLPQELQDVIVSQLRPTSSRADWLSLSCTYRQLRYTCLPFIYEQFVCVLHNHSPDSTIDPTKKIEKELISALSSSNAKIRSARQIFISLGG